MIARAELYALLAGATISEAQDVEVYGVEYPALTITTRRGRKLRVFVQADEEGNAGGYLDAEEV